ncbi:hypothetical protein F7D42_14040 [Prevotella copri]|uniref:Uncharacterized protein n=1 Tax=Segatella copri TaxID=165179 RepID=A0A5P0Y3S6_9BACT|nr:hypothetical protein [Segatella copri]MBW0033645.1 hypothetical protein [Segatella copri]MQM47558.1 hypothetical protein [Segatella copri]MQM50917.1 hypothetical protein [Segatella copri]MQM68854.1 hypothetical protein [Segatella copri]MQM76288.1 hypothetical protein [Segatella copri]
MTEEKIPQPTFLSGLGDFYFNIKYDDSYPFIFTNIKGPILVKEEDMDTYIRNHEDDFIGQVEESLPRKSYQRLFELFDIDTDWLEL